MKQNLLASGILLLAALSCSTTSRVGTQAFDDGVYSRPVQVVVQAPTSEELDNLLADSHASQAYILSAGDTLFVPEGKKIRFSKDDTIITVWDTPAWAYSYSWAYRPWYMRDYWGYYGPWHYDYFIPVPVPKGQESGPYEVGYDQAYNFWSNPSAAPMQVYRVSDGSQLLTPMK